MASGHTVDTGKINAAGSAYSKDGADLGTAAAKVETGVSAGQIGKAWSGTVSSYSAAIKKYRDTMTTFGQHASDLGGKLTAAAAGYEKGEEVNASTISKQDS
ncbi:MAG: hypothetical protein JWQ81_4186 [Amycolatopsis sp.]|jgi:hypothetical protein|uniref:type VII secretion target n=1 Tax=Amycolatopsis sp. TaxID=37632 RepID=UPI002626B4EB|nr:type VII secretion target [Amycolatopsis sp.]MCU1683447.1 hypothetical protein [Amycolatopsis sp.]